MRPWWNDGMRPPRMSTRANIEKSHGSCWNSSTTPHCRGRYHLVVRRMEQPQLKTTASRISSPCIKILKTTTKQSRIFTSLCVYQIQDTIKKKKIIDSSGHLTVFSILTKIADVIHSSGLRIFVKIIGN